MGITPLPPCQRVTPPRCTAETFFLVESYVMKRLVCRFFPVFMDTSAGH